MGDANCLYKTECLDCHSRDNLGCYDDGSTYCFGCKVWTPPPTGSGSVPPKPKVKRNIALIELGDIQAIENRGISELTCYKMKYTIGTYQLSTGEKKKAHIVNVPDQAGNIVAQKIRLAGKQFRYIGDTKAAGLVFQDVWQAGSSWKIIICEGEIDALSVSQAQENLYPVVSVPNGAAGALKSCTAAYDYLSSFKEVIIMFDMDEAGKAAAKEVSKLFGSKAKTALLPEKDPNFLLMAGRNKEIIQAIWDAQPYRPDGVVTLGSLRNEVTKEAELGKPWIYETLTKASYGRRKGELYFIGAGSGIGKTDFMLQQAQVDMSDDEGVALFLLEQPVLETAKRLCGKQAGRQFHIPDIPFKETDLLKAFDELDNSKVFLYDHFGSKDWDTISQNIRWLAVTEGVEHFYIDHLTALVAHEEDERRALERITAEMSSLAQELGIYMYVISHLSTPDGTPHEEGGRVMAKHFKGSRAIIYWAHFMFGLERNTQHEDPEMRQVTTFRVLKDRFTGKSTGLTFHLGYEFESGTLYEQPEGWVSPDEGGSTFENY